MNLDEDPSVGAWFPFPFLILHPTHILAPVFDISCMQFRASVEHSLNSPTYIQMREIKPIYQNVIMGHMITEYIFNTYGGDPPAHILSVRIASPL